MPHTAPRPVLHVHLYTRRGCRSCDDTLALLGEMRSQWDFTLEEIDVDSDPALSESVGCSVPLVTINGGSRVAVRIDSNRLGRAFQRAHERAARSSLTA